MVCSNYNPHHTKPVYYQNFSISTSYNLKDNNFNRALKQMFELNCLLSVDVHLQKN